MGVSWIFNLLAKVFAKVFFVGTLGVLKTHEPQENSEYWSLLVSDNLRLTQLPTKAHGWGSTFGYFTSICPHWCDPDTPATQKKLPINFHKSQILKRGPRTSPSYLHELEPLCFYSSMKKSKEWRSVFPAPQKKQLSVNDTKLWTEQTGCSVPFRDLSQLSLQTYAKMTRCLSHTLMRTLGCWNIYLHVWLKKIW